MGTETARDTKPPRSSGGACRCLSPRHRRSWGPWEPSSPPKPCQGPVQAAPGLRSCLAPLQHSSPTLRSSHSPHHLPTLKILPSCPHHVHRDMLCTHTLHRSDAALVATGTKRKEECDAALQASMFLDLGFSCFSCSIERLLAGQFCGHASTASRLPAACLPLAAVLWFELPSLVTFQCKVHFFPSLTLLPLAGPRPGAPFDLVLVKSCRTWPQAVVQVQSSRAEHKLLWINLPLELEPEHACDAKFCLCLGTRRRAGLGASKPPTRGRTLLCQLSGAAE